MFFYVNKTNTRKVFRRAVSLLLAVMLTAAPALPGAYAQSATVLPPPGTLVRPSGSFTPVLLTGMAINPQDPFRFDFIVDPGDSDLYPTELNHHAETLIKYFMASLTVPEKDMWVNLSPYERDRIVPEAFGSTEMGKVLLEQDYILKQLAASFMHPEEESGREFWNRIHRAAADEQNIDTEFITNSFNKIWIVPQEAEVFVHDNMVFVERSSLKVMLEQDYYALEQNSGHTSHGLGSAEKGALLKDGDPAAKAMREIILPRIEYEVNHGETFAPLRQVFHSLILAVWYKQNLRQTILSRNYVDQSRVEGIKNMQPYATQDIYERYVQSIKTGVYNLTAEEYNPVTQEVIHQKYFGGGVAAGNIKGRVHTSVALDPLDGQSRINRFMDNDSAMISVSMLPTQMDDLRGAVDKVKDQLLFVFKVLAFGGGVTLPSAAPGADFYAQLNRIGEIGVRAYPKQGESPAEVVRQLAGLMEMETISPEHLQAVVRSVISTNDIKIDRTAWGVAESLDLFDPYRMLLGIQLLESSDVLAVNKASVGGKELTVYFLDVLDNPELDGIGGVTFTKDTAFVFVSNLTKTSAYVFDPDNPLRQRAPGFGRFLDSHTEGKTAAEISVDWFFGVYVHEIFNTQMMKPLADRYKSTYDPVFPVQLPEDITVNLYGAELNMSASLGELAYSRDPLFYMGFLTASGGMSGNIVKGRNEEKVSAKTVVTLLAQELGFSDYYTTRRISETGRPLTERESAELQDTGALFEHFGDIYPYYFDFVLSLDPDSVRAAAKRVYERYYGTLPAIATPEMPPAVIRQFTSELGITEAELNTYISRGRIDRAAITDPRGVTVADTDPDNAQLSDPVGGIDFNPEGMNLKTTGDVIDLDLDPTMPAFNVDGLVPVIINITPVTPRMILGEAGKNHIFDLSQLN